MNCTVTRDSSGNIVEVLAQNGNTSNLFYDLLMDLNDPEEALHAYAMTMTASFNDRFGDAALDENGEHTIETYKQFESGGSPIKPGVKELFNSNLEFANQVYEALGFNSIITIPNKYDLNKDYNIKSVINNFTNTGDKNIDSIYKILLNAVSPNIKIEFTKSIRNDASGEFIYLEDKIKLNADRLSHKTLIHEIIHSLTHDEILKNKKFNDKITSLRKQALDYFKENRPNALKGSTEYALSNNDEFLAGIFNYKNTDFLNTLNNIPSGNNSVLEKLKNIFKEFILVIAKISNININKNSLLFEVINELGVINTEQITQQQKQQALQQYSAYLDTIFPNSKVKDIVYHGTALKFDKFNKSNLPDSGIYFDKNKATAYGYGNVLIPAILNSSGYYYGGNLNRVNSKQIRENGETGLTNGSGNIVFEPEQIHILGNQQDIQGFKNYVEQAPATIDLGFTAFGEYLQIDPDIIIQNGGQLENATAEQKKTVEKVIKTHNSIKKKATGEDTYVYTTKNPRTGEDVELKSATTYLDEQPEYTFEGNKTEDTRYIDWGNIADDILSGVVLGKTFEEIDVDLAQAHDLPNRMTIQARKQLFDIFTNLYNEQRSKGNILLTQVRVGSYDKKIGGTIDLLIVKPDGSVQVMDLKTSVTSVLDSSYRTNYKSRDGVTDKASKYQKHSAQLSIYASVLKRLGYELSFEDKLNVIPILIIRDELTPNVAGFVQQEVNYVPAQYLNRFDREFGGAETKYYKETYEKVIATLRNLAESYKRRGDMDTYNELTDFVNSIADNEYFDGMTKFTENAYERFLGRKGLKKVLNNLLNSLDDTDNIQETINSIVEIESVLNIFSPENGVNALGSFINSAEELGIEAEPGSILYKAKETNNAITTMRSNLQTKLPRALAKYLVSNIPKGSDVKIIENLQSKRAKLKKLQNEPNSKRRDKKISQLEKEIDGLIEQFQITEVDGKEQPDFERMLELEISDGAYRDISIIDRWAFSAVQMPVGYLSLYVLSLKKAFTDVQQLAIPALYKANNDFNKFMEGRTWQQPDKLFKDIYTTYKISGKEVLAFVNPIDYNKYNEALSNMKAEADRILDTRERNAFIAKWYAANTEQRPDVDYKENGVTLIEGLNTVFQRKREMLGDNSSRYNRWYNENTKKDNKGNVIYTNELVIPRRDIYRSSEFDTLKADKSKFELYTQMLDMYFDSQKHQPQRGFNDYEANKYIAPFVPKSSMDRLTENGAKSLVSYKIEDMFKVIDDDINEVNYDASNKSVNILYFNSSFPMSAENTTKDLMSSVLRYKIAADRYAKRAEIAGIGELLYSRVSKTNPHYTKSDGSTVSYKHLKGKVASFLGKKQATGNNAAAMLRAFINMQVYGMTKKESKINLLGKEIDLFKLSESIMEFGAFTQLGFDVTLAVANSLTANVTGAINAAGRNLFGVKAWAEASAEYLSNEFEFVKDSFSPVKQSFLGQMMQLYDVMQGEFYDEYGTKIGKSKLKDKWYKKAAFAGMHKGEHRAQGTAFIATMRTTKVKFVDENGKESMISLMDAYHIPPGKTQVELKQGVQLDNQVGKIDIDVMNKIHSVSTSLYGIYNKFEQPELYAHWVGNLISMYRKFLPAGIKYRYKKEGFDYSLGDFTKGTYTDFWSALVNEPTELLNKLKDPTLTSWEQGNIRIALFEHLTVIGTGALVIALKNALEADDEDTLSRDAKYWGLYFALRLNNEIATFGTLFNPVTNGLPNPSLITTFNQVSVASSIIQKGYRFVSSAGSDVISLLTLQDITRYERDTGMWKKGDSKTLVNAFKLLGINNRKLLTNPEDAVGIILKERI